MFNFLLRFGEFSMALWEAVQICFGIYMSSSVYCYFVASMSFFITLRLCGNQMQAFNVQIIAGNI